MGHAARDVDRKVCGSAAGPSTAPGSPKAVHPAPPSSKLKAQSLSSRLTPVRLLLVRAIATRHETFHHTRPLNLFSASAQNRRLIRQYSLSPFHTQPCSNLFSFCFRARLKPVRGPRRRNAKKKKKTDASSNRRPNVCRLGHRGGRRGRRGRPRLRIIRAQKPPPRKPPPLGRRWF